jgi:PAS domain S-box-containing protein
MSARADPGLAIAPPRRFWERWARYLALVTILSATYAALGKVGLTIHPTDRFATLVWAPTGLSLAALVTCGTRLWPGVALGAFITNTWAGAPLPVALGMAAGNTLEALLGAGALKSVPGFDRSLARVRDVFSLVVPAALFSTLVSAVTGVSALVAAGLVAPDRAVNAIQSWWLGDAVSDLVVAPLLLVWLPTTSAMARRPSRLEATFLGLTVVGVSIFVFGGQRVIASELLFPVIIWAALRFGQRGAATSTIAISLMATFATVAGRGPFAQPEPHQALVALQALVATVAVTSLMLGAIASERALYETALLRAQHELERRVAGRTAELTVREAQLREAQRIAHLGSWEWDIRANSVTWSDELYRVFGVRRDGFEANDEGFFALVHPADRDLVREALRRALAHQHAFRLVHRIARPDGRSRSVECHGRVHVDANGQPVRMTGTVQDVTSEQRRERALRGSVHEKDLLLHEMHHRVKNNLQIVASLLALQGRAASDRRVADVLTECQNRVRAIALVHEQLHGAHSLASLDFEAYLRDLVGALLSSYGVTSEVLTAEVRAEAGLGAQAAIPCGLIVNELVSNSIKHAFPGGRRGRIEVLVRREGATCALEVADDGVGMPRGIDLHSSPTLGLKLVGSLAEQLGGTATVVRDGGAGSRVRILLPAQT